MSLTPDQQQALDIQNQGRTNKSLQPLQWDPKVAQDAQAWAQHLASVVGHLQHSAGDQRPGEGENLFWALAKPGPYKDPFTHAAQSWMNEAAMYQPGEKIGQGNLADYGHYTQCMWSTTTQVGMGSATDSQGGVYIVGRYSPPGNIVGQAPY
ncbi:hypothetical protein NKR23_g3657 [Pleurostoma richardsiae]|uniref:SCP domain-containing protein n=1 Tax=Pleurostoma richardsiae TaxID=41990 RepID=A0AA38RKC1_9PEZI|nr:hypothetical protein NKR23_g3657 [Pleurostoma richardsiae]